MNKPFDAYHQWLGIPPAEQPADHYRLLGISLFESDAEVIATAADQRMAYVRSFQLGANAVDSQRLLNELSSAKMCLLDERRRAQYDTTLRPAPEVAADAPVAIPPIDPNPTDRAPSGVSLASPSVTASPTQPAGRRKTRRRSRTVPIGKFLVISALTIAALCCIVVVQRRMAERKTEYFGPPPLELSGSDGDENLAGKTVIVKSDVAVQNEQGGVVLTAASARRSGKPLPIQNGAIVITAPDPEPLKWKLLIDKPAFFMIVVTYAANQAAADGVAEITVGKRMVRFHVRRLEDEQTYADDDTKMVVIRRGGQYTLSMKITELPEGATLRIKSVQLIKSATRANR